MSTRKTYKIEEITEKVGIGPFGSSIKVDTFVEDGIPVISGTHLKGMRLEDKDFNFITIEHADKLKNANVKRGDVIFTHAGNIGTVAFIPENSRYERYILSQRQFYLRCNKEKLLPEYITYYFKSPFGQKQLLANASSVGVPSIARPVTYLRSIEVEIPDIKEQEDVIEILESLENKIELNFQMNQSLDSIAETIFQEWFIKFKFPNFDGKLVDGLPAGWRKGKLGEVLELLYGKALKADIRIRGEFPVIGSNGIVDYHNEYLVKGSGIVIGRKGTIGEVIWIDENFFPIDTTFYVKDKLGIERLYFHYFLLKQQEFKKIASDSAVPGLNRNQAMDNIVIIPELSLISEFNAIVKTIFEKKEANTNQNNSLTLIRDGLLPKLMTGKIEINN